MTRTTYAASVLAFLVARPASADILFNTDVYNTTGSVANDYHVKLTAADPITITTTFESGGDVAFGDAVAADGIEGNGTTEVQIDWEGATVNQGQTTHVGAATDIGSGTPNELVVTESWWTFGGLKLAPSPWCSAVFDGVAGTGDWTVVKIEIYDDPRGTNLLATQWVEGRGSTADIVDRSVDGGRLYARWAFRPPQSDMIPIEDLNGSLGGFEPFGPIVQVPSGGGSLSLETAGSCPGSVDIDSGGITPFGSYALLRANELGSNAVPGGPCAGAVTSLGAGMKLVNTFFANDAGEHTLSPTVPVSACGTWLQVIDLQTCELSPAVSLTP